MFKCLRFEESKIRVAPDPERLLPKLFGEGSGMHRFVTAEDHAYRAGFTRVAPGQGFETFFWYDEFWIILRGKGRVKAVDRISGLEENLELTPDDAFFIGKGTHISAEAVDPDQAFCFMYIAIPASKKEAAWLANMTPEDVEDVRIRVETEERPHNYHPRGI
jgi:mannose-6-phosphate isomerase-like protein (cupin superfamily)